MSIFLSLLIGIAIGYLAGRTGLSTDRVGKESFAEKQAREKKEGKQKVLEMLTERGEVTNKDVEQTLGVSDATATRYLNELEKEGMAAQIGKSGPYVSYRRR